MHLENEVQSVQDLLGFVPEWSLLGINSKCLLRDAALYPEVWCKIAKLDSYP